MGQAVCVKKNFEISIKRTTFWPFGGHLGWHNHPISTKNAPEWSPRQYLWFDIWHDHIRSKVKFDPHLTPWATAIFDHWVTVLAILEEHHWSIISTKVRRNPTGGSREEYFLRICAIFRRRPSWIRDDIHFNKFENASPKNHNCEVWPSWTKRFVWRRIFKSLLKERHFYLLAAILDDVIIRFQQKLHQSDRLINIFNLVSSNLTPIWPPGYAHFWPQGHDFNNFERALSIDHSYQVSKKSGWRFVGKRCFKNLCYF